MTFKFSIVCLFLLLYHLWIRLLVYCFFFFSSILASFSFRTILNNPSLLIFSRLSLLYLHSYCVVYPSEYMKMVD